MTPPRPKVAELMEQLLSGPKTSLELSTITGVPAGHVSAHLRPHIKRGRVIIKSKGWRSNVFELSPECASELSTPPAQKDADVEWRPIARFDGHYQVSNTGNLRSSDRTITSKNGVVKNLSGKVLALHPDSDGYMICNISFHGKPTTVKVHAEVLEAFVGPRPDGQLGCHNDGDPSNNSVGNLRWGTPKENAQDRYAHGTHLMGDLSPRAIMNEATVAAIKAKTDWKYGDMVAMAREHGVSSSTIHGIASGKTWQHVTPAERTDPPL